MSKSETRTPFPTDAADIEADLPLTGKDAAPAADALARDPLAPERVADRMLNDLRPGIRISIFDWTDPADPQTGPLTDAALAVRKTAADFLVKSRLARFSDSIRSHLAITNAGRYWALNGGFMAYLKEDLPASGANGRRQNNADIEALRAGYIKLMQMRLNTFWWSFGLSIAGFIMSLISVTVALIYGSRLFL